MAGGDEEGHVLSPEELDGVFASCYWVRANNPDNMADALDRFAGLEVELIRRDELMPAPY